MIEFLETLIKCGSVPNYHIIAAVLHSMAGTVGAAEGAVSSEQSSELSLSQNTKKQLLNDVVEFM